MNAELNSELAATIQQHHHDATKLAAEAQHAAKQAIEVADQCGGYLLEVRQLTRGHLTDWLRDHAPSLPVDRAKAYLGLRATRARHQCKEINKRQMMLAGILEARESRPRAPRIVDPTGKWFLHVGKIREWFTRTTQARPLEEWTHHEAEVAAMQLRPIVEIYQKILSRCDDENAS
jgi:hypothetical protein